MNENYFDEINTAEKAYFLGLLYADGYNNVKGNQITLSLKSSDKDILRKFKKAVGTNIPLKTYDVKTLEKKIEVTGFYMNSDHMSNSLAKWGCIQNKGEFIRFPFWLDISLRSHFVRGYFDGDGGLSREKSKNRSDKFRANIVSNPNFIDDLNKVMYEVFGRTFPVQRYYKHKKTTQLRFEGNKQVLYFLSWIYNEATVFLNRKYKLFQDLLNYDPTPWNRSVFAFSAKTGDFIGEYESRMAAGKALGIHQSDPIRGCQNDKKPRGRYYFSNKRLTIHEMSDRIKSNASNKAFRYN